MKIKKYILILILSSGMFSPLTAKADTLTDIIGTIFNNVELLNSIPDDSCIASIDIDLDTGRQSKGDLRGLRTDTLGFNVSGMAGLTSKIIDCRPDRICNQTGFVSNSGETGSTDNPSRYDAIVNYGECVSEDQSGGTGGGDGGSGVIGNLRQGLNDLRGIFPSRLQSERGIVNTIGALIRWVLGIAGTIFVAMIVYGGIQYLTVGTNEKNIEKAKSTITYAVIGIVIIAGAWLIADFVISALIRGA